ncbi:sel1 repeat family protein [Mariniblastus sp.]|nr:sel1 repeat family protein [Mariniblastus sp.]
MRNFNLSVLLFYCAIVSVSLGCKQEFATASGQDRPAGSTVATKATQQEKKNLQSQNPEPMEGMRQYRSRYFSFDYPSDWALDQNMKLTGADAISVKATEHGPYGFYANISFQSLYVGDVDGYFDWKTDGLKLQSIGKRQFQVRSENSVSEFGPTPLPIVHRSYDHVDVARKRMFFATITCGATNKKDMEIAKKIVESIKVSFPEVEQPTALKQFRQAWNKHHGLGCKANHFEAEKHYQAAAEQGSYLASMALAIQGLARDNVRLEARRRLELRCRKLLDPVIDLADLGNCEAQTIIAFCFHFGFGTAADWSASEHWFQRASEQGCPVSTAFLGRIWLEGRDSAIHPKALELINRSIKSGYANAELLLAEAYGEGAGVKADPEKCFALTKSAAEKGVTLAINSLALFLSTGRGTVSSPRKAFDWCILGAKTGDPQNIHAVFYCLTHQDEMSLDIQDKECDRVIEEIRRAVQGKQLAEFALAKTLVEMAESSNSPEKFKRYLLQAKVIFSKHAKSGCPDAWYELKGIFSIQTKRDPSAKGDEIPYCRKRAAELGHAIAAREYVAIETEINRKTRAYLASVRWDKAAARKQESVGGFIAPEWAYEPTPAVAEFRSKNSKSLSDKDVLVE